MLILKMGKCSQTIHQNGPPRAKRLIYHKINFGLNDNPLTYNFQL
jgi:hypothetical protein